MTAGARVGPWELVAPLGRGATGAVFRARDPATGVEAALKLLHAAPDPARRERFAREAAALRRLRHPGIVALLDAGEHEGHPWLATELVAGTTLGERLERGGALPPREAVALVRDLARALAHAHALGVLHRDLKPDNVLLDLQGRPRLVDFGLVRDLEADARSLTQSGVLLGTPGYWSPEQARGEGRRVGPAADVYGLAAVLYAALTREPPIDGESLVEAVTATATRTPDPPSARAPGVDPALDALVLRGLAKDPADRPADAAAFAELLDAWLRPPRRPRRRRAPPLVAVLGAAGLVVVGAGLGLALRGGRPASPAATPTATPPPLAGPDGPRSLEPPAATTAPATTAATPTASAPTAPRTHADLFAAAAGLRLVRRWGDPRRCCSYAVMGVAVSADGRLAVLGGGEGVVRVWDLERDEERLAASFAGESLSAVALAPDERTAFVATVQGRLHRLDLRDGARATLGAGAREGWAVAVDGARVYWPGGDGVLRGWDAGAADASPALELAADLGALNDLARGGGVALLVGERGARRARLAEGTLDPPLVRAQVRGAAVTPDGATALTVDDRGALVAWDVATGAERWRVTAHRARVNRVVTDGATAWTVGFDGAVMATRLDTLAPTQLGTHAGPACSLALALRARVLVTGGLDHTARVFDVDGRPAERRPPRPGHAHGVSAVQVASGPSDDPTVVSAGASELRTWALRTGEDRVLPGGLEGQPPLAYRSEEGQVLFGVRGAYTPSPTVAVAATPDGRAAWTEPDGRGVVAQRGAAAPTRTDLGDERALALAWHGDEVLVGARSGALLACDAAGGLRRRDGVGAPVAALAPVPGDALVVATEAGEVVRLAPAGPPPLRVGRVVRLLATAPDGARVAGLTGHRTAAQTGVLGLPPDALGRERLLVLDAATLAVVGDVGFDVDVDVPTTLAWADARTLLVGTARGSVLVLELAVP